MFKFRLCFYGNHFSTFQHHQQNILQILLNAGIQFLVFIESFYRHKVYSDVNLQLNHKMISTHALCPPVCSVGKRMWINKLLLRRWQSTWCTLDSESKLWCTMWLLMSCGTLLTSAMRASLVKVGRWICVHSFFDNSGFQAQLNRIHFGVTEISPATRSYSTQIGTIALHQWRALFENNGWSDSAESYREDV